ncbi:hypothetical protein [Aridibaculum aurantiacum]|uniref:hypothetical protein n=1 Tax=Aridibaculum aurantiacum TaxID=2810307 RepID=UPI001A960CBA|nr:hypothetical protein [Aridibaculum aurantiacum]
MMKQVFSIAILSAFALTATAQRRTTQSFDTTKKTVVITSAYKPEIKPAAKINFSASTPPVDTARTALTYNVPAQNLFFTYQPALLKPLALSIDTAVEWNNESYVKAGFGNFRTPFAQAGISFGDGKSSAMNVHARHISQKGNIPFQQYSHSNVDFLGVFNMQGNNEWRGKVGFDNRTQYLYGFQPDTLPYGKDQLRQRFTTLSGVVGFRNKVANEYGITYDPSLNINLFTDNKKGNETNFRLNAPVTKTFGRAFGFNLGLTADITTYKTGSGETIKNNLYFLTPSVLLKTPNLRLNLGFTPAWDNQVFSLLPNFTAEAKLKDERFVLQAGWVGYFEKNDYRTLTRVNPFIHQPHELRNTRIREQYAGFKGSAGSHFTYNGRISTLSFSNAVLYVNDTMDGKTFMPLYESSMKALRIHGEVGYTVQEKFSLLAGTTINQFSGLSDNERAWGLIPLELTGALRWQVLKDVHVKSDFFFWDGARFRTKNNETVKLNPAVDLNAGVEFKVMPKLNLWIQFNNLLNNRYQRWNQYEVLGFNVMGGVVYSFSQIGK